MNIRIRSLGIVALMLTASAAAYAGVHVNVDLNPFGWGGAPPPVVYAPPGYYAPPPVVYAGRGYYGGDRDRGNDHDHGHDRGRDHRR